MVYFNYKSSGAHFQDPLSSLPSVKTSVSGQKKTAATSPSPIHLQPYLSYAENALSDKKIPSPKCRERDFSYPCLLSALFYFLTTSNSSVFSPSLPAEKVTVALPLLPVVFIHTPLCPPMSATFFSPMTSIGPVVFMLIAVLS